MSDHADSNAPVAVLIVEDEALIRDVIGSALREAGYDVTEASRGDKAIAALEASSIRALVTDINLGREPSGWLVARRAREVRAETAVVYVTGGNGDEWLANGVPQSILITKPFAPAQVVTAISQLLNAGVVAPSPSPTS